MSAFKYMNFTKEFAYRTMINYYLLRDCNEDTKKIIANNSPRLKSVIEEMKSKEFDTSMEYEVTLLINSMTGLLVFPQQAYYKKLSNRLPRWEELIILKKCIETNYDDVSLKYINTYEEEFSPCTILKHLRNSLSHDNVQLFPESIDSNNLTHIIFKDSCSKVFDSPKGGKRIKKDYDFSLAIPVEKLEAVVMAICRYLIEFEE